MFVHLILNALRSLRGKISNNGRLSFGSYLLMVGILSVAGPFVAAYIIMVFKLNSEFLLLALVYGMYLVPFGAILIVLGYFLR